MNSETNHFRLLSLAPDRNGEAGADCEIILPDYCPNILRILQHTACPTVNSAVRTGERVKIEGSVEYKILYLAEDGCTVQTICQQAPFSSSVEMNCDADADFTVRVSQKNCTARALNQKKIYARCSVQITVKINQSKTVPCPALPEDCERKLCKKNAARHLCSAQKPLRISDDFETDTPKPVAAILQTNILFRETEQKPLSDKLIVKADMIFDLLCTGEDHTLFPVRKVFPISQILDLPGVEAGAVFQTEFEVISSHITVKGEGEESSGLSYDVEIRVSANAYQEIAAEWIEDAYSVKKSVECTKESVSTERFMIINEAGAIKETVDLGICTGILWMEAAAQLRGTYYRPEDDMLICEGVWDCRILMTDSEGTLCCTPREIPFALEIPANGCNNPVRNDTKLVLTDISWSLTDTTHGELRGTYHWNGMIFHRETSEAVGCVTEKEARKKSSEAVVLYYASKGESAWKIAKEHACPYEEFLRSNRLNTDDLDEDKMLMIVYC